MRRKRRIRNKRIRAPTNSGYSEGGASLHKDSLRSWQPKRLSSKSDIDANLVTLRNRAADQATNTPIGSAAIMTSVMQSVGAGLKLFPRIPYKRLGLTAEEAREWCRNTAAEFDIWAGTADCDLHRRNNFYACRISHMRPTLPTEIVLPCSGGKRRHPFPRTACVYSLSKETG